MRKFSGHRYISVVAIVLMLAFLFALCGCRSSAPAAEPDKTTALSVPPDGDLPDIEELRSLERLESFDFGTVEPDLAYLEEIRTLFPDCVVRFRMNIAGETYDSGTVSIVSDKLTARDVAKLYAFPSLQSLDARGSACVDELKQFESDHPDCVVCYSETLFGYEVSNLDTYLDLSDQRVRVPELKSVLDDHPNLTDVNLIGCSLDNSEKCDLHRSYPDITFYWHIYFGDGSYKSTDKKLDFTRLYFSGLDELIELTGCFMHPEYVDVSTHGFENSEMEKISDLYPDTLFVWMIRISTIGVRTDIEVFDGTVLKDKLKSSQLKNLKYCRNLKAIDLTKQQITDLGFVSELPELRVLLLGSNSVTDLSPLADLPNLQYLALYSNGITDISPLSGLSSLRDLNLSGNRIDDMTPLSSCGQLEFVHLSKNPCSEEAGQQNELRTALPNTLFVFDESSVTRGWSSTEHSMIVDRSIVSRHYYDLDAGVIGID